MSANFLGDPMLKILCLFLFSTTLMAVPVNNGSATFTAIGSPSFLKIDGEGIPVSGDFVLDGKSVSGEFKARLDKVTTGIGLRDEHLRTKYLDIKKFPEAKFTFKKQPEDGSVDGILTIKDDSKPATFNYTVSGNRVKGSMKIQVKDYPGIGTPEFKGITVSKDVEIFVEFNK